jgi:predicted phage tail protein
MTRRKVRLYGRLGALFGRVFEFALDNNSIAEAVAALSCQLPGFKAYMMGSEARGIGYAVFVGKRNVSAEQLSENSGSDDIRIAPVVLGSKNGGLFQIVLGAVLIIVGTYVSWFTGPVGAAMVSIGWGMVFGGVVQLLSPKPKGTKTADSPDNQPSYVFNGATNTQAQGNPVPLGYGRMIVGSAVISAGIQAEDYAQWSSNVSSGTEAGQRRANFYDPEA